MAKRREPSGFMKDIQSQRNHWLAVDEYSEVCPKPYEIRKNQKESVGRRTLIMPLWDEYFAPFANQT